MLLETGKNVSCHWAHQSWRDSRVMAIPGGQSSCSMAVTQELWLLIICFEFTASPLSSWFEACQLPIGKAGMVVTSSVFQGSCEESANCCRKCRRGRRSRKVNYYSYLFIEVSAQVLPLRQLPQQLFSESFFAFQPVAFPPRIFSPSFHWIAYYSVKAGESEPNRLLYFHIQRRPQLFTKSLVRGTTGSCLNPSVYFLPGRPREIRQTAQISATKSWI